MTAVSGVMPLDTPVRPSDVVAPPAASLDDLPLEILMEIASSLDCWSLLSLERVSERCREAVALHLGRVNVFKVSEYGDDLDSVSEWTMLSRAHKVTHLSRLTGLRRVYVYVTRSGDGRWLLEALVTASTGWSRLEKLSLNWLCDQPDPILLGQLCSNCTRLTDVTLSNGVSDQVVEAVLTARHGQLRRLGLQWANTMHPDRLAASLAGCVRLESLTLRDVRSVINCLPSDGLPALRHLSLTNCRLTDSDLAWLVERQPCIDSVALVYSGGNHLTQDGLAMLGRLPALRSVRLECISGVSDVVLDQLSRAPLTELQLGFDQMFLLHETLESVTLTAAGLLRLTRNCPALRWVTLWEEGDPEDTKRTVDSCRSSVGTQELLRIFGNHIKIVYGSIRKYCHLSAAPPGKRQ